MMISHTRNTTQLQFNPSTIALDIYNSALQYLIECKLPKRIPTFLHSWKFSVGAEMEVNGLEPPTGEV